MQQLAKIAADDDKGDPMAAATRAALAWASEGSVLSDKRWSRDGEALSALSTETCAPSSASRAKARARAVSSSRCKNMPW
jgi:hypothetical protein